MPESDEESLESFALMAEISDHRGSALQQTAVTDANQQSDFLFMMSINLFRIPKKSVKQWRRNPAPLGDLRDYISNLIKKSLIDGTV